jgi:hypothetical protein
MVEQCAGRGDVDAARRAPATQGRGLLACRAPPLGAHGALLRAACLLPEQERHQDEAPPGGHIQDLVKVRAAEHQRSASGRPVPLGPVLGEAQLTALVAIVEVEGEREPTVRGRGAEVVAVSAEQPTVGRLVAGNLEALEAARPVRERLRQLGQDPTTDRVASSRLRCGSRTMWSRRRFSCALCCCSPRPPPVADSTPVWLWPCCSHTAMSWRTARGRARPAPPAAVPGW